MRYLQKNQQRLAVFLSVLAGAAIFLWIYGLRVLDPTYTDWIFYRGTDLPQHYLGWAFFRNAEWAFPIGMMDTLGYPYPTSVVYLDAIPLFAIPFKLLSPFLPDTFQYLGLWGLLCFMLQGGIAAALCSKYTRTGLQTFLASLLFILSPVLLDRMYYHTALASHWVILLAMLLVSRHETMSRKPFLVAVLWTLMGVLSAGIHQYFLVFCGVLCFGYSLYEMLGKKRWYGLLPCLTLAVGAGLTNYVLGAFSANVVTLRDGFTQYSFNLNGFINPRWNSELLEPMPTLDMQYEGYAYLGFGVLLLCVAAFFTLIVYYQLRKKSQPSLREDLRNHRIALVTYGSMCLIFLVLALSPVITLNDRVLIAWQLPQIIWDIWSIFRASGRLIWPVIYIITLTAVMICVRRQNRWVAALVLVCCVGVQFYDLSGYLARKRIEYHDVKYESLITQSAWDDIAADRELKHLVVTNSLDYDQVRYTYAFADVAAKHKWTMNNFYFARSVDGLHRTFEEALEAPRDDTIVVVLEDEAEKVVAADFDYFYALDGFVIALNRPGPASLPEYEYSGKVENIQIIGTHENINDGEDINGVRHIHPGGMSYGPYAFLFPGEYKATIQGTNLDVAGFDCVSDYGNTQYELLDLETSEAQVQYRFQILKAVDGVEWRIYNNSSTETITISSFAIEEVK